MPIITLRFKDVKIRDYPIAVGQTCTIGRKHSNDIVIDHLTVSGSHARVESLSSTFVLRDLESTNGTFVNNEKITMHNLRNNDVIMVGNHNLLFDMSDLVNAKASIRHSYEVDKTRIYNPNTYRGLPPQSAAEAAAARNSSGDMEKPRSFFSRLLQKIFG